MSVVPLSSPLPDVTDSAFSPIATDAVHDLHTKLAGLEIDESASAEAAAITDLSMAVERWDANADQLAEGIQAGPETPGDVEELLDLEAAMRSDKEDAREALDEIEASKDSLTSAVDEPADVIAEAEILVSAMRRTDSQMVSKLDEAADEVSELEAGWEAESDVD